MDCGQCTGNCHPPGLWSRLFGQPSHPPLAFLERTKRVALVGCPNVGKSLLFNALTQSYATVSNYPGTTVEVTEGQLQVDDWQVTLIDTPGTYSLMPVTEEEAVTRTLLLTSALDLVLHVVDAKNLGRMLPMTLQLIEANVPTILVMNMVDEAARLGLSVKADVIAARLGIPVVTTSATRHQGIAELIHAITRHVTAHHLSPTH
ncbi:MAG: GTP-binding protein [Cyanothece sp. SIO2G6]|nr:GTP-binding protein [Cyanothece sp. SIO2G6]